MSSARWNLAAWLARKARLVMPGSRVVRRRQKLIVVVVVRILIFARVPATAFVGVFGGIVHAVKPPKALVIIASKECVQMLPQAPPGEASCHCSGIPQQWLNPGGDRRSGDP
jgi:hypothetical protein